MTTAATPRLRTSGTMNDLLIILTVFVLIVALLRLRLNLGWVMLIAAAVLGLLTGVAAAATGADRRPLAHRAGRGLAPRGARLDHGAREHPPEDRHPADPGRFSPAPARRQPRGHGPDACHHRHLALGRRSPLLGAHGGGVVQWLPDGRRAQELRELLVPPHLGVRVAPVSRVHPRRDDSGHLHERPLPLAVPLPAHRARRRHGLRLSRRGRHPPSAQPGAGERHRPLRSELRSHRVR